MNEVSADDRSFSSPEQNHAEKTSEISLRPKYFKDFIGQKSLKDNLQIFVESAITQGKTLDHILLYGPPGLGKTTLAGVIANEMRANIHSTAGPVLSKVGDLAAILTNLKPNDILFVDEIHRMPIAVEEMLYSAMEDFKLDIIIGEGPAARSIKLDLPRFTLIGATTRVGLLSNPIRSRFGILLSLDYYDLEDLCRVLAAFCKNNGLQAEEEALAAIASASRRTPRIALRVIRRILDFVVVSNKKTIDLETVNIAKQKMSIDAFGLDKDDLRYLQFIGVQCSGGPVGIETISSALSEDRRSIEEIIEPFLIKEGFVLKTPRGRVLTEKGIARVVKI